MRLKEIILLLLVLFVKNILISQNIQFLWAGQMGGLLSDYGYSIALDGYGNIFTTGCFEDSADLDPGTGIFNISSSGYQDIFVTKLDTSGDLVWAKHMGGAYSDLGHSITVDETGNLYTTGIFYGPADFDPDNGSFVLTPSDGRNIFILKLNSEGNFIWAKLMGGMFIGTDKTICLDASENVFITGFFIDTADFDPGDGIFNLTSIGERDVFITKLDALGNFIWAKQIGGSGFNDSKSIALDNDGKVYITGQFDLTSDFDPGVGIFNLTSLGGNDIFITKLDQSGNFIWAKQIGGGHPEMGYSIVLDKENNVYLTGFFSETVDFDPGIGTFNMTSEGVYDIFVLKLDELGNFIWAKQIGGTGLDWGNSIVLDNNSNIYITGAFTETVDFDPGNLIYNLSSMGNYDNFILKLNSSGDFVWAGSINGLEDCFGYSIVVDYKGNIYSTGSFLGVNDFDPGIGTNYLTPTGDWDVFMLKLKQTIVGNEEVIIPSEINLFLSNNSITVSGLINSVIIDMYDIVGKSMGQWQADPGNNSIDLNAPRGIYLVRISGDDIVLTKKIYVR